MIFSVRTDQQWLAELADSQDPMRQQQAHLDLANYLYVIAFNYLRKRQATSPLLATFAADELAAMGQDFVQEVLLKLSRNDFALLQSYQHRGKFTSWCARMVCNQAAAELRRPYWTRRAADAADQVATVRAAPERAAELSHLRAALAHCLEQLPTRQRVAFEGLIIEERAASEIAAALQTQETAVYQLVYRARAGLRRCLEQQGIDPLDF